MKLFSLVSVGVTSGTTKLILYIVITQLLFSCWIKLEPKDPQWCISLGDCFGSLLYKVFILRLSMLQGSTTFWLTLCHACMNLSICRGSSRICWVVVPMQLTFLLFPVCQLLRIFGFLWLFPCLSFNYSVTMFSLSFSLGAQSSLVDGLMADVQFYHHCTFSASTIKTYGSYFRANNRFCALLGVTLVPALTSPLCMYAAFLAIFLLPPCQFCGPSP